MSFGDTRKIQVRLPASVPSECVLELGYNSSDKRSGSARSEGRRRRLVTLVLCVLLMVIFEGALRKWIFVEPSLQRAIIFARDPLVIWIYASAISWGRLSVASVWCLVAIVGTFVLALTLFAQIILGHNEQHPVLIFYAFRNYLLYLPLVQVTIENFAKEDLIKACRLIVFCSMLSAPLMIAQFAYPPDHVLNQGFGISEISKFENLGLAEGIVRATGLFTSSAANTLFTLFALAAVLYLASATRATRSFNILSFISVAVCVVFSGSRGVFFQVPLLVLSCLTGLILAGRGVRASNITALSILVIFLAVPIIGWLAPSLLDATYERFAMASEYEDAYGGISGRVFATFTSFWNFYDRVPFWGLGAGYGTNAAIILGVVPISELAESDWERHVYDLGIMGSLLLITIRIVLSISMLRKSLLSAIYERDHLALTFCAVAMPTLLFGQIVGHNSINGLGLIGVGLCLAAAKHRTRGPSTSKNISGRGLD